MKSTTTRTPGSFSDLLDQIHVWEHLRFTGDPKPTLRLDHVSGPYRRTWARRAWEALAALDTYGRLKRSGAPGSFWTHCCQGRVGMSLHQYSPQESDPVMTQWGRERSFPVPTSVDPTGEAVMVAHIRIGNPNPAPRLYFMDRTDHGDGILVGWIGPHLTAART